MSIQGHLANIQALIGSGHYVEMRVGDRDFRAGGIKIENLRDTMQDVALCTRVRYVGQHGEIMIKNRPSVEPSIVIDRPINMTYDL